MSSSYTPYIAYGAAESFGKAADRLASENNKLIAQSGYKPSKTVFDNGSIVANAPNCRTFVYNPAANEWRQIGRWNGGVHKKIAKTRCKKCAKSSKKCRHSHHKNTAKRSRRCRRTKQE